MDMASSRHGGLKKLMGPISISALMFSTYVGPGFASGTQTVSFFLTKGWVGVFWGPVVVGLVSLAINLAMFELNRVYKPENYRQAYNSIYRGKASRLILSNFKDITSIMAVIVSVSTQISAASILFNDLWGLPMVMGTILFSLAILALAIRGASLIRVVGTLLTCCILGVCIYMAITGLGPAWPQAKAFISSRVPPNDFGFTNASAWFFMVMFCSNFVFGYDASIPTSLGVIKTRGDVVLSAVINIVLCTLSTIVFTVIFAAGMPVIAEEPIPTMWAIRNIIGGGRFTQILYAILAISAMLSTGVSLIYAVSDRMEAPLSKIWVKSSALVRKSAVAIFFILLCIFGSTFGIINLVRYGFTYVMAIAVPVLLLPLIVMVPYRLWKDKKRGITPEEVRTIM